MKRMMLLLFVMGLLMSMPVLAQAKGGPGAVYAMTNADEDHGGNQIVVYHRSADGILTLAGTIATGGNGETTESGDALGASNPLILSPDNRWLFAVNAGSDTISVFQVDSDNLTLVQGFDSHGELPVSLTIHKNLLYVLNARALDSSNGFGNIAGFTFDNNGHLTFLDGSIRWLEADTDTPDPFFLNSPAQVGFTPLGDQLVVTVKEATSGEDPKIHVFTVDGSGLPSAQPVTTNYLDGPVPFGFTFDNLNNLLVAEPFGPNASPVGEMGAASSYRIAADGTLDPISTSVSNEQLSNEQTATCWIAITTNTRFAYTTNNISNTISSYMVGADGSLSLISKIAARTGDGPVDLAITPNNQYLYNVNALDGTVSMFKIDQRNGNLVSLGEIGGLPDDDGNGNGSAVGIAVR